MHQHPRARRRFSIKTTRSLLFLAAVSVISWMPAAQAAPARPNIILILVDDMGFSDLGCFGSEIGTPNIDRLAKEGLTFTNFHNASKCEPSRASLLSGLYWQTAGCGIQRGITMGDAMRAGGYHTIAVGKWHVNGKPVGRGFDRSFGMRGGATQYFAPNDLELDGKPFPVTDPDFYLTDAFTDYAIRFIGESVKQDPKKPFFLFLAYNAPHSPLQARDEDIKKYGGKYDAGWDKVREARFARQQKLGIADPSWKLPGRPDHLPAWDSLSPEEKKAESIRMTVYAAMIDRVDQGVGRIEGELDKLGIAGNTLIFFLSDNGANPFDRNGDRSRPPIGRDAPHWEIGTGWAWVSDTPFRWYKRFQHEGGTSTPLLVRWPDGVKNPGRIVPDEGHIIDLMPTLNALSGLNYASVFEGKPSPDYGTPYKNVKLWNARKPGDPVPALPGKDLTPIFSGNPIAATPAYFYHLFNHRAVNSPPWKIVSASGDPWELYEIGKDRTESSNLAAAHPEIVDQLDRKWNEWFDSTGLPREEIRAAGPSANYRNVLTGAVYEGNGKWRKVKESGNQKNDDE